MLFIREQNAGENRKLFSSAWIPTVVKFFTT